MPIVKRKKPYFVSEKVPLHDHRVDDVEHPGREEDRSPIKRFPMGVLTRDSEVDLPEARAPLLRPLSSALRFRSVGEEAAEHVHAEIEDGHHEARDLPDEEEIAAKGLARGVAHGDDRAEASVPEGDLPDPTLVEGLEEGPDEGKDEREREELDRGTRRRCRP